MLKEKGMMNSFYKHGSVITHFDKFLSDSDLMLIKLKDIRQIYRELKWDKQLPDQMNILAYSFGQNIFDRRRQRSSDIYANMSVFYHKQTDSCYMI